MTHKLKDLYYRIVALEKAINFPVHEHLATLGVSHLSEWDALVFLYRHGAILANSPQMAHLLGYGEAVLGTALDRLESIGLVKRSLGGKGQCLYRFSFPKDPAQLFSFAKLMDLADKRTGRLRLRSHLQQDRSVLPTCAVDSDLPLKGSLIVVNDNDNVVRTGIAGLDDILLGGIPRKNLILVEGTVGTGNCRLPSDLLDAAGEQEGNRHWTFRSPTGRKALQAGPLRGASCPTR